MKILHVLDHSIPLQSGYSFRTRSILLHQRALGWETFHVTGLKHHGSAGGEERVDGLDFHRARPLFQKATRVPVLNQVEVIVTLKHRLKEVIRRVSPDVIHAHSPALNGIAALSAAKEHHLPFVYEVRAFWEDAAVDHGTSREWGARYRLTRAIETHVLKRADRVTTICNGLKNDIVARGIPPERVTVIPNAVDTEFFRPGAVSVGDAGDQRRKLKLEGKTVLGFIGSYYAYEGLALLVEALPAVLEVCPNIHVLLAGGGPQSGRIARMIAERGLGSSVTEAGRVPHSEVQRYYEMVDVFVYPRLSMRLTELVTPLKPLEAMALGKLVLASDVGGHRELIEDGVNGFLFPAGSAAGLASGVIGAMQRHAEWDAIRSRARDYIDNERTWARSVDRYRQVYEAAIRSHG